MKSLFRILVISITALFVSGCADVISDGNVGVARSRLSNQYSDGYVPSGRSYNFMKVVDEVQAREIQLNVNDVRPKDRNSVMLEDLDFSIVYRVNPEKIVTFLRQTNDQTLQNGVYIIGQRVLLKDAQSFISEVVRKYSSMEILDNKSQVEKEFTEAFQQEVDRMYGKDVFIIVETKFVNIMVAKTIEERMQAAAVVTAERDRNNELQQILESRADTLTMEIKVIKDAAIVNGVSVEDVLQYRLIEAIRDNSNPITIQVN